MVSAKHYVWTYYYVSEHDKESTIVNLLLLAELKECKYISFQCEMCPTTGEPHMQGYVEFRANMNYERVHEITGPCCAGPNALWIKQRRGGRNDARDYTQKSETRLEGPWEAGTWDPVQAGMREDLKEIGDMVIEGKKPYEIYDKDIAYVRYYRFEDRLRSAYAEKRTEKGRLPPTVVVINGETGSGKTRFVMDLHGSENVYVVEPPQTDKGTVWFSGYTGQKYMLIDEFDGWMSYKFLLRLIDRYKLQLPTKGGHTWMEATHIYITTTNRQDNWYPLIHNTNELTRRITRTITL